MTVVHTTTNTTNDESTPLLAIDSGATHRSASLWFQNPKMLLYFSHATSQFAELSWQISLTLFLAAMAHFESLFFVSAYGVISQCFILCSSSAMARFFVDQISWNRQSALNCLILAENTAVITGCFISFWIFQQDEYLLQQSTSSSSPQHQWWIPRTILLTLLFLIGSIGLVLEQAMVVLIERDWLIVVAQQLTDTTSHHQDTLSEMNVVVRQINLSCRVLAPAFAGSLIGWLQHPGSKSFDLSQAAIAMGILNLMSMAVELTLMSRLYHRVPLLNTRTTTTTTTATTKNVDIASTTTSTSTTTTTKTTTTTTTTPNTATTDYCYGFWTYWQQPVAAAGLALSLLYLNALTLGTLMIAYLLSRGMAMKTVGLWRGLSAISGLCGTVVYRHLRKRFSLVVVGFVSILFQCFILSIGIVSLFLPNEPDYSGTTMALLIGSVILSRIGLYAFDISVTQLMQEHIPAPIRGAIGGTQQSLNAAFQIASFVLSMAFQKPSGFPVYATVGYLGTVLATALFGWRMLLFKHSYSVNGHTLVIEATKS